MIAGLGRAWTLTANCGPGLGSNSRPAQGTSTYTHLCTHTYTHQCTRTYTDLCTRTYTDLCTRTYTNPHTRTYTHLCTRTYTDPRTHTYLVLIVFCHLRQVCQTHKTALATGERIVKCGDAPGIMTTGATRISWQTFAELFTTMPRPLLHYLVS